MNGLCYCNEGVLGDLCEFPCTTVVDYTFNGLTNVYQCSPDSTCKPARYEARNGVCKDCDTKC